MTTPPEPAIALASAVRHEANNMIAAISGTAEILLRVAATDRDRARAERILQASRRLEALLKGYLSLPAPPLQAGGTDAAQILALMHPLLVLGPARPVDIAAAAGLPRVAMPVADLQAAILDLARQAAEAAPRDGGLSLRLDAVPGGVRLAVSPTPSGEAPPPLVLPAAPPGG